MFGDRLLLLTRALYGSSTEVLFSMITADVTTEPLVGLYGLHVRVQWVNCLKAAFVE